MAQHKAPTAVTFAPTTEPSGFTAWITRYWKVVVIAGLVVTGAIVYLEYSRQAAKETNDLSWERLMGVATEDRFIGQLIGSPEELQAVAAQVENAHAAPWALYVAATSAVNERKYQAAKEAISKLRAGYPDHALVVDTFRIEEAEAPLSALDRLERRVEAQEAWAAAHPTLFENPELPADAPRVRLKTDRGDIVLGLYSDAAPKHVENFVKLIREGFYSGTKFHRVVPGSLIEGGDPKSIRDDPSTWGTGGPEAKVDREENSLKHFPGVLSAVKQPGDEQSSGSQFMITTGPVHYLDGQNVVFGKVLEGIDVARQIERGGLVQGTARPEDPARIESAEVL